MSESERKTRTANEHNQDLINFKGILRVFVRKLLALQSGNKPEGIGRLSEAGHKNDAIRNDYIEYRDYSNGYSMDMSIQGGFGTASRACMVHWFSNRSNEALHLNIVAKWNEEKNDIAGLYIYDPQKEEALSKTFALTELSLFNEKSPNEKVEDLFNKFSEALQRWDASATNSSTPTHWFTPANPQKYLTREAFRSLGAVTWRQSTNVKVGDIVYVYIGSPEQCVAVKSKVTKTSIAANEIDDSDYQVTPIDDHTTGQFMRLELIDELVGPAYGLPFLKLHGFQAIQGPVKADKGSANVGYHNSRRYIDFVLNLQKTAELQPDNHDASYQLMRETIHEYSKMESLEGCDYRDLDLIRSMIMISKHNAISRQKRESIESSNLSSESKARLRQVLEDCCKKAENSEYDNVIGGRPSIGMFTRGGGTTFKRKATNLDNLNPRFVDFIKMCVDILEESDDAKIFSRCENTLSKPIFNMGAAVASPILHCLKPNTFPILNDNQGMKSSYDYLGLSLKDPSKLTNYIENCKKIRMYRDDNYSFKNYRIFDLAAKQIQEEEHTAIETEATMTNCTQSDFTLNTILYGPPGTGKTYQVPIYSTAIIEGVGIEAAKTEAVANYGTIRERYQKYVDDGQVRFTTFHQSYSYEEFIEGIRPVLNSGDCAEESSKQLMYTLHEGLFKNFCETAKADPSNNYVFVIDEINRGNISKIFGELITLIEDDKRIGRDLEIKVSLPYSNKEFGVPNNVYILGTMNTSDRSLAHIDTALRRRFNFFEIMPDPNLLNGVTVEGVNIETLLDKLNQRLEELIDREHTIGHSYFMSLKDNPSIEHLATIFKEKILPLLQEYFFDDYEKIQLVLGDNLKDDPSSRFIEERTASLEGGRTVYRVNWSAFDDPSTYSKLHD